MGQIGKIIDGKFVPFADMGGGKIILPANKAVVTDSQGNLSTGDVTAEEVRMLRGVNENLQEQINAIELFLENALIYKGAVTEIEDIHRFPIGIYSIGLIPENSLNLQSYSILYKPYASSLYGAMVICDMTSVYGGMYYYQSSSNTFIKA